MGLRSLALLCLVGAAFAGPFQRETESRCSTHCPSRSTRKFQYETGKKYVYEYRGENYITIAGNQKQKATVEGLAEFHVMSTCDFVLKLKNVRITQKLSASEISELVQKLEIPLPFSTDDGTIDKVCPSSDENVHSLNIKKGVLSSIVNTMTKLDAPQEVKEYDSLGKCLTKYTVKYANGLQIRKVKDLKSCTNRHSSVTSLITSPYDSPNSRIHTLPVFPEEHLVCTQSVEDRVIKGVKCQEHAKIKPLKNRESVIEFDGSMELKFLSKSISDLQRLGQASAPQSLLYNLEEEKDLQSRERETEDILREMCSKNNGVIDITVSKDFIKLVTLVKTLPYKTLEGIHKSLKNGRICNSKKVLDLFVDTLPMAGSDSAIKLLVHLLENKEVQGLKAKLWPASLALIPKPTKETISAILPLLMMVDSAPVLLGVSAMLHRFCSSENCDNVPEVHEIVAKLDKHLGHRCSARNNDMIFSILKAFGNIGYHGDARENIIACAQSHSKPLRLRLAAVDAFRRMNAKRPQELLDMYLDTSENFEMRIAALSSVLKHVDEEQLTSIKQAIERESNTQVSAYASTLINNMKKTSSPLRKNVKNLLKNISVNPPKVNYWENSKNIEFSLHNEALNVGGAVESDIIHSPDSKLPRSLYSRFDVDVFDKSLNLFEFGIRAEGLEEVLKKLIGMKDNLHSWNLLNAKDILSQTEADASLFIRTMNVEIFDVAASDISALGEMFKIAELMTKLAHERTSDFSHSFLFLNSKLVIPSVTGKTYSLGVTGSATVALTASTKLNLLSFPKSADIHAHFQPSVNVEMSTTVGIQSNKQRPDLKLVSQMHMESNMEAKFQINDEHIVLASLSMPSENVALAKFSSDVFEIDSNHNEKRVFDKMQNKIDYCFDKLEKPLGISVCGKWEVPKPFVIKSFPFIQGVGNVELAIKKTDNSFSSYEATFEMPRHQGPHMKYQASLDTPGSKVNRRFAAELDLKHRSQSQTEFSLELTSPFKKAGGSGSFTKKSELIQGSLELHSDMSKLFSVNASTTISSSRSKTTYKPSLKASVLNSEPLHIGGSVTIMKGRKQQISIDIKSNKPSSKPISIKGTVLKEGRFEISRRSEWKVSSDFDLQSPLVDGKLRNTIEKKSDPNNKVSTRFSVDYQIRGMKKQTVKFSGLAQSSSSKINVNTQFESTQFPQANWSAIYHRQEERGSNLKNDLTIRYGRHQNYVTMKQESQKPSNGPMMCHFAVKAPQFNVDSELTVSHSLEVGPTPKLNVEADLRYKGDKHIKGLVNMNYESRQPLKASTRIEIEHPEGKLSYTDEIVETRPNDYNGKSRVQWREHTYADLVYRYQKLNVPGRHYEVEGSLTTSSSQSPIKSKLTYRQDENSVNLESQLSLRRNVEYSVEYYLNRMGEGRLSLKAPKVEGDLKVNNGAQQKSAEWNLNLKSRSPRRIVGSALVDLGNEKKVQLELLTDADRRPERKISLSTSLRRSTDGENFDSNLDLQVNDLVTLSLTESGSVSLMGHYETKLEATVKNYQPIAITYQHDLSKSHSKSLIKISKNHVEKAQLELEGSLRHSSEQCEISGRVSLQSLDNSFESKEWSMRNQISSIGSSKQIKSEMRYQQSQRKMYRAEWNSEIQPNSLEISALLHTPHLSFEKQSLRASYQRSNSAISSSLNIEIPNNKVISITTDVQTKDQGLVANWKAKTPFDIVRNVNVYFSAENQSRRKSISSYFDVNSARIADIEASMATSTGIELNGQIKIAPIPNVDFQGLSFSYKQARSLQTLSGKIDLANSKKIVLNTEVKEEGQTLSAVASLSTPFNSMKEGKVYISLQNESSRKNVLFYVDVNEERKGDVEVKVTSSSSSLDVLGRLKTSRTPEISTHFKIERQGESFLVSGKALKGTSPLWSTVLSKEKNENGEKLVVKTESFEKTLLDLQVSNEVSTENQKFRVKASGRFTPVSLQITSSSSEKSSLSLEITACQESQTSKCYTLKGYHKALTNSESYRFYKKLTFDLEKSIDNSEPIPVGSIQLFLSSSEHDYRSKLVLQYQEKNIGYEVRVHKRLHDQDHCSMDLQVLMPERNSRMRASLLHSSNNMLLEVEAIPNEADSSRKFSLEMKGEARSNEVSGHIKAIRPDVEQPIMLQGRLEKRGLIPVRGSVELRCSPSKVWTFEITPEQRSGRQSLVYRLYKQDQSLDMSVKLIKENSRRQNMYAYEWRYQSKQGGLSVTLNKRWNGKPESIKISYHSPNANLNVEGSSNWEAQGPKESSLRVSSGQRVIKEIRIFARDSCLNFEVQRSGPFFKSSACINVQEGKTLQLVKIDALYRQQRCLDVRVSVDPQTPSFLDVTMEWKKNDLRRALNELTGLRSLVDRDTLRKWQRELKEITKEITRRVVKDHLQPYWRDLSKSYKELKERISEKLREYLSGSSQMLQQSMQNVEDMVDSIFSKIWDFIPFGFIKDQIIGPVKNLFKCLVEGYFTVLRENIAEFGKYLLGAAKEQLKKCFSIVCSPGSLCQNVVRKYQRHGYSQAKKLIQQKIDETKNSVADWFRRFYRYYFSSLLKPFTMIRDAYYWAIRTMNRIFGDFITRIITERIQRYGRALEDLIRHQASDVVNYVIERIKSWMNRAERDEDFKTLITLIKDAKRKVIRTWQNREKVARQTWKPVKENITMDIKKAIRERFELKKYNPKEGQIQFRVRNPLGPAQVELLKNELRTFKRMIMEWAKQL